MNNNKIFLFLPLILGLLIIPISNAQINISEIQEDIINPSSQETQIIKSNDVISNVENYINENPNTLLYNYCYCNNINYNYKI